MIPVIISGGSGTRLWPLSRAEVPKQLCRFGEKTLLEDTIARLQGWGTPWILTTEDLALKSEDLLRSSGIPNNQILVEPIGRNTAPAIAFLCKRFLDLGFGDEIVGVFPADHYVRETDRFRGAIDLAARHALSGNVVTLGIKPNRPATGFGYIETNGLPLETDGSAAALSVMRFREKPNQSTAEEFLSTGRFFWNAGIFLFNVATMVSNFETLMPALWGEISRLDKDLSNLKSIYERVASESVDIGVMEKLNKQVCVSCDVGWDDLGSWDDIARMMSEGALPADRNRSTSVQIECHNNFSFSQIDKAVAFIGIDDVIAVETPDALLICRRGESQSVRKAVQKLHDLGHPSIRDSNRPSRKSSEEQVLHKGTRFEASRLSIAVDGEFRSETSESVAVLTVAAGSGHLRLDTAEMQLIAGAHFEVPRRTGFEIRNTGSTVMEIIEVKF